MQPPNSLVETQVVYCFKRAYEVLLVKELFVFVHNSKSTTHFRTVRSEARKFNRLQHRKITGGVHGLMATSLNY
jgi:hypothetical protein